MKVHELVASFGRAGESANPMDAAHEILESLREEVEAIEKLAGLYLRHRWQRGAGVLPLAANHATQSVFSCWASYATAQSRNMGDDPAIVWRRKKYALPPRKWQVAQSGRDDTDARRDTAHARRNRSRGSMP